MGRLSSAVKPYSKLVQSGPDDLAKVLKEANISSIVSLFKKNGDCSVYTPFLQKLQQLPKEYVVLQNWIIQLTEHVVHAHKLSDLFLSFMDVPWADSSPGVVAAFNNYVLSVVTEHSSLAVPILEKLFKLLVPTKEQLNSIETNEANPAFIPNKHATAFRNVCTLITSVVTKVPLAGEGICRLAGIGMPFLKLPTYTHVAYLHNLLLLSQMLPNRKATFLEIIMQYLLSFDNFLPQSEILLAEQPDNVSDSTEIFAMEIDDQLTDNGSLPTKQTFSEHPVGKTLDILMCVMIRYIHGTVHGFHEVHALFQLDKPFLVETCPVGSRSMQEGGKQLNQGCHCKRTKHENKVAAQLYLDMKKIFSYTLLRTHSASYVQYLYFYLLAIRPSLLSDFLDYLTAIFQTSNELMLRRNALSYLGSLLARGSFVTFSYVSSTLEVLTKWCKDYQQKKVNEGIQYDSMWIYAPYYHACQVIFYIFTFRHKELMDDRNIKFSQNLRLDDFVISPLNPLNHCITEIVDKFAAVANHYQVAYCYGVLENNRRMCMPVTGRTFVQSVLVENNSCKKMIFPFEPYMLSGSKEYFKKHYTEFAGFSENIFTEVGDKSVLNSSSSTSYEDYSRLEQQFGNFSPREFDFLMEQSPCL